MQSRRISRALARCARWVGRLPWRRLTWLPVALAVVMAVGLAMSVAAGGRFLVVEGGSMRPALRPGDLLVVRPCAADVVRRGDVVTYQPRPRSASVTHRVIRVRSDGEGLRLVTKGDANRRPDEIVVRDSNVRGRVVAVVPKIGAAARWLRTPAGFGAGVIVPALILVVGEVRRIRACLRAGRAGAG